MTHHASIAGRAAKVALAIENTVPSRKVAALAALGVWFLCGGVLALLRANGFGENITEPISRGSIVIAALVYWEIRRFKELAKLIATDQVAEEE